MERFRIEVGEAHGAQKANIVGAVANESGIENEFIGHIEIYDQYSTIDLPEGMPDHILKTLQQARVAGHKMQMSRLESFADASTGRKRRPAPRAGRGRSGSSRPPRRTEGRGNSRSAQRRKPSNSRPKRHS